MYFEKHVFVCENLREGGRECCADKNAVELRGVLKRKAKEVLRAAADENGNRRRVRINGAACLDRCEEGPVVVVYPEGRWFRMKAAVDVERFAECYLRDGDLAAVEDLRLPDEHPSVRRKA